MIDPDKSSRESSGGAPAEDEHHYEPPMLTALGSFAEFTKVAKSGSVTDPGDGFQPSNDF